MTLKVVRVTGDIKPTVEAPKGPESANSTQQARTMSASAAANVASAAAHSDAAHSSVKVSGRPAIQPGEKIREYKQAKEVASELSERIPQDSRSDDAHGSLSSVSAKGHLMN